ncbi:MAG: hypothetical protein MHM6MM_003176 [Cercozoa sp. M6MM]
MGTATPGGVDPPASPQSGVVVVQAETRGRVRVRHWYDRGHRSLSYRLFSLQMDDVDETRVSQTIWSPKVYLWWRRLTLLIWTGVLALTIIGDFRDGLPDSADLSSQMWLFSTWVAILLWIHFLVLWLVTSKTPVLAYQITWLQRKLLQLGVWTFELGPSAAAASAILFWCFLLPSGALEMSTTDRTLTVILHGISIAVMCLDVLSCRTPFVSTHVWLPIMLGGIYLVTNRAYSHSHPPPYQSADLLDWDGASSMKLLVQCAVFLGVLCGSFVAIRLFLVPLRNKIVSRRVTTRMHGSVATKLPQGCRIDERCMPVVPNGARYFANDRKYWARIERAHRRRAKELRRQRRMLREEDVEAGRTRAMSVELR